MKSLLIGLTLLCISASSFAQLDKGTWLVGGSGSFNSFNQKSTSPAGFTETKFTNIELSGSLGYFFVRKLVAGLRPGYYFLKGKQDNQGEVAGTTKLGIGPFVRYYFLDPEKQFNLLADVSYQIGFAKQPIGTKSTGKFTDLRLLAGTEVFFNSSVGLELLIGYSKSTETLNKPSLRYSYDRSGVLVSIGFQFHLEKN